ncbi:MAG: site-specific integrase [Betaproteobacteria bacterium]|nr:site-specific integrase [Betaproteobacteria bacterium]
MANQSRKYIKTKFEGVFYRLSTRRDPRTGECDRVYCFWYADAEGKGHWKTVGRHSKGERPQTVRQARAEFLAELAGGSNPIQRDKYTVGDAVDAYVAWARGEGKHIAQPMQQYDKHMRARLHAVPVSSVTPSMLSRIKAELMETPATLKKPITPKEGYTPAPARKLSPQTVVHQFSFLRRAVNRAVATGDWSGVNPFASRQSGPWQMPRVDNKRLRFFTPDEAAMLLAKLATSSRQLHDMALLSLKTGMRATEIFKLRAQDVDAHAGILHVTAKGGRVESVQAPKDVITMLRKYGRRGGEYIFQERSTGDSIKRTSDAFNRAVVDLGLDTSEGNSRFAVTFHTLRHTFASWLAQSGKVSLLELKALMRHETLAMTQRYAHLIPGQERKRLAIIDTMLNAAKKHS